MRRRTITLCAAMLIGASSLGGCVAATALDAAGSVVATSVKTGVKVAGATVGVAADGAGALARTVAGSGTKRR